MSECRTPDGESGPLLSIVTVVLNDRTGLRCTRQSLEASNLDWFEHVIVDGHSSDGTHMDLGTYESEGAIVVVGRDSGIYDAMNIGARHAKGRYLLFLNAGDELLPGWVESIRRSLEGAATAGWVIFGAETLYDGRLIVIQNLPHVWSRHALGLQPHCHQSTIFSASLFAALDGYSEAYDFAGDFDIIVRAGLACKPLEVPIVITRYEGHGVSAKRSHMIPGLQSRIRRERFQFGPFLSSIDSSWAIYLRARQAVHRRRTSLGCRRDSSRR